MLNDRHSAAPCDRPIALICGIGYRGSIAASFLKSNGYQEVANVLGGMTDGVKSGRAADGQVGDYSHSIVAGGLLEMSYTTRLTPLTSLMIRLLMVASTS